MHAIIAFAIGPIGRYFVLGGLLLGLAIFTWFRVDQGGFDRAMSKVQAAFTRALGLADARQDEVQSCPLGKWNRGTGRCDR